MSLPHSHFPLALSPSPLVYVHVQTTETFVSVLSVFQMFFFSASGIMARGHG